MRETRSSGSVEGVVSNRDPYSDFRKDALSKIVGIPELAFPSQSLYKVPKKADKSLLSLSERCKSKRVS